jgi:hypothetical protein
LIFSGVEDENSVGIGRCAAPGGTTLLSCDSAGASWLFSGAGGGGGGRMGSLAHGCLLLFCYSLTFGSKKRLRIYSFSPQFNFKSKIRNNYGHQIYSKIQTCFYLIILVAKENGSRIGTSCS